MTILEMMTKLETIGDASIRVRDAREGGKLYYVTMEDFLGFDEEWNEIDRDYADETLVDDFLDALTEQAIRIEGDFYRTYYFDGYMIRLDFASYDI